MTMRILAIMCLTASSAFAGAVLNVVETPGDYYTITAVDADTPSIQYWQCKVDIASGSVFQFLDYTDASGGTVDYMGTNSGYNRNCSLLRFWGRGGDVCARQQGMVELATHLTFDVAPDGSAFTITYAEDGTTTDFFQDAYASGDISLNPGDLLTTIVVTIRPPTSAQTAWDWSISQRNVSDHGVDPRVWAQQEVRTDIVATIARTLDSETSFINGYWDDGTPVSFARYTIDTNAQGLTAGREFIIDYRYNMVDIAFGNTVSTGAWAGFDQMKYQSPLNGTANYALASGDTRTDYGQLRINIAAPATGAAPTAVAGADQSHTIHTVDPADVTLDGTGSADADGSIVSHTWTDMAGDIVATGATPALQLAEGDYYFTLIVEDNDGNVAYDEVRVQVLFEWDYTLYDAWPGRNPADPNQLVNLHGQSISRPVITDLVWPANPGEADVCLYEDDKFAAVSLGVDDNTVPDHDWWIDKCNLYGFSLDWFVIVGDHRLNGGNAYFGTWDVFQTNIVDRGQSMQSHTVSHAGDDGTRPAAEMHWEYSYSRALIDANMTDNKCLTVAYPSGAGQPDIAALYYIAARGTVGGANQPHNTDYMYAKAGSLSQIPDIINPAGGYARGWLNPLFHLVQDRPALEAELITAAGYSDQVWFGSFTEVAKYGQERDTATLTVTAADETTGIEMELTDRMWDDVFDYPLTIKVRMYPEWTDAHATQDGDAVDVTVVDHAGSKYALVKATPDQGDVVLMSGPAGKPGDCDGDGDVDLDDFVILKQNFGQTVTGGASEGDFDGDGDVDLDDFVILKQNFGT